MGELHAYKRLYYRREIRIKIWGEKMKEEKHLEVKRFCVKQVNLYDRSKRWIDRRYNGHQRFSYSTCQLNHFVIVAFLFLTIFFFNFSMTDIHSETSMIAHKNVCLFSIAIDVNWKLLLWPYGSSFQSKAFSLNIFLRIKRGFLRIHWKYHTSWKLL